MKALQIDGMTCVVGQIPRSGFTVGSLIKRLKGFEADARIGFCTGPGDNLEVLSIYQADDTCAVWFDLGEP